MKSRRGILLAAALAAFAAALAAQGPEADWRTVETEHYRVHYPAPAEAWAHRAAARLEAVRRTVAREVGYHPEQVTDVLVMDPLGRANGSAWPFLRRPRMVLWTTPPGPQSVIGHYRDWSEILLLHEDVHLSHLLRPSRSPGRRALGKVIDLGPLATRAPRWVTEGYATYLEGRLTGFGRPNSDLRATVLRRWAQAGELPGYAALSADSRGWLGMSMAYLLGSAYLEWLVEREGEESLRSLWARLSARRNRSFDEAFAGVFGDNPRRLYNRFRAELTYRAMRLEEELEPLLSRGELWQDLSWSTGPPAVSPDGGHLALVLRAREGPSRLVVWSTGPAEKEEKAWREERERIAAADPEDVPAERRKPLARKPLHELVTRLGAEPYTPRWSPDGRSLVFVRFEPDARGVLHPDLFRWTPETGSLERLTRGADLREPDVHPAGTWAVAVRHRNGLSQLVGLDFTDGRVKAITRPSLDRIYHHPRFSPDGKSLAFIRHGGSTESARHHGEDGEQGAWHREDAAEESASRSVRHRGGGVPRSAWHLVVRELESGRERVLPTPERGTVAYPAWGADSRTVYASVGREGLIEIHAFSLLGVGDKEVGEEYAAARLVVDHGAALAPAPAEGALFYLHMEPDGLDLRRLELAREEGFPPVDTSAVGIAEVVAAPAHWPAVRPPATDLPAPLEEAELPEARPYGAGRQEWRLLAGGNAAPGLSSWELGLRMGDVVGRLDLLAVVAQAEGGAEGGALALAWRRWPVRLEAHLFTASEELARGSGASPIVGAGVLDLERWGFELTAAWERRRRGGGLQARLGLYTGDVETLGAASLEQSLAFLRLGHRATRALGPLHLGEKLRLSYDRGETEGRSWSRWGGEAGLELTGREGTGFSLAWRRLGSRDISSPFERFRLGGLSQTLLPRAVEANRIFAPALPPGVLVGDEAESQRAELRLGGQPFHVFYERHRLWAEGAPRGEWLALAGAELRLARAPWPLLALPAMELRLGVAWILDAPLRDEVEAWLGLRWRP